MSFISFQNPAALFLLPLAVLPLLIHLLRHQQARVVPFPSILLLSSTRTQTWKRSRLQEWLLMFVRMVILLLLVLLLAGPTVNVDLPWWMASRRMLLVLIIDDSASMSAVEGGNSLLSRAKASAEELLSTLSPDSRVAVISGSRDNKLLGGLSEPSEAIRRIKAIEQTQLGTDLAGAVLKADAVLASAGQDGAAIWVISDFRKNAFGDYNRPLPPLRSKASLSLTMMGNGKPGRNLEWREVRFYPLKKRLMLQGKAAPDLNPSISLIQEGRTVYNLAVRPDPAGNFSCSMGWDGQGPCFLQCSDDDLPLDDRRYLDRGAAGDTRVLLLAGGGSILQQAFKALSPAGYRLKSPADPDKNDISSAELIVLAERQVLGLKNAILQAVKDGSGLLIIPPETASLDDYNQLLSGLSTDLHLSGLSDKGQPAQGIELAARKFFQDISPRDLRHVSVHRFWRIVTGNPALLTVGRESPGLLMMDHGSGKAGIWLFGTEPGMSDVGFHPAFLAILNQTCQGLLKTGPVGHNTGQFLKGETGIIRLTAPNGEKVSAIKDGAGNLRWPLEKAGFYTAATGSSLMTMAVNIPPDESDLAPVEGSEVGMIMGKNSWSRQLSPLRIRSGQRGSTDALLFLTGLFLMLELVLRGKLKIFLKNPLTT